MESKSKQNLIIENITAKRVGPSGKVEYLVKREGQKVKKHSQSESTWKIPVKFVNPQVTDIFEEGIRKEMGIPEPSVANELIPLNYKNKRKKTVPKRIPEPSVANEPIPLNYKNKRKKTVPKRIVKPMASKLWEDIRKRSNKVKKNPKEIPFQKLFDVEVTRIESVIERYKPLVGASKRKSRMSCPSLPIQIKSCPPKPVSDRSKRFLKRNLKTGQPNSDISISNSSLVEKKNPSNGWDQSGLTSNLMRPKSPLSRKKQIKVNNESNLISYKISHNLFPENLNHVKHCKENKCPVPYCLNIKNKLKQQQLQQCKQQAQILKRYIVSKPSISAQLSQPSTPQQDFNPSPGHPSASQAQHYMKPATATPPPQAALQAVARVQEVVTLQQSQMNNPYGKGKKHYFQQSPNVNPSQPQMKAQPQAVRPTAQNQQMFQKHQQRMLMAQRQQIQQPANPPQQITVGQHSQQQNILPLVLSGNVGPQQHQQINVQNVGQQQIHNPGIQSGSALNSLPRNAIQQQQALQQLLATLNSPDSPQQQQQQQVLSILKSNPALMAAFIRLRSAQQQKPSEVFLNKVKERLNDTQYKQFLNEIIKFIIINLDFNYLLNNNKELIDDFFDLLFINRAKTKGKKSFSTHCLSIKIDEEIAESEWLVKISQKLKSSQNNVFWAYINNKDIMMASPDYLWLRINNILRTHTDLIEEFKKFMPTLCFQIFHLYYFK